MLYVCGYIVNYQNIYVLSIHPEYNLRKKYAFIFHFRFILDNGIFVACSKYFCKEPTKITWQYKLRHSQTYTELEKIEEAVLGPFSAPYADSIFRPVATTAEICWYSSGVSVTYELSENRNEFRCFTLFWDMGHWKHIIFSRKRTKTVLFGSTCVFFSAKWPLLASTYYSRN